MKKIVTFLFAWVLLCLSSSATTYLIQSSETGATWSGVSGTVVNLSALGQSLDAWYTATVADGDQIWIINGTYTLTGVISTKGTEKIYGGFVGTEQTVDARAKGAKAWEYTNATVIDGAGSFQGISVTTGAFVDGLTIQNCKSIINGSNVKLSNVSAVMQNCIIKNGISVTANVCPGIYITSGAKLFNSYIHNNVGSGSATSAGGVQINALGTVSGCTIDNNTANTGGGGIYINGVNDATNTVVTNNIITNNKSNSYGGGISVYNGGTLNISSCTISSNTAVTNGGGIYFSNATSQTPILKINNCIFESNTAPTNGGAIFFNYGVSSGINPVNNCIIAGNTSPCAVYVKASVTTSFQNCTIASNVKADATAAGIYLGVATTSNYFTNCLFYNSGTAPITYGNGTGTVPTVAFSGFDIAIPLALNGPGCVTGITAASFKDVANNDWHLVAGSPAIDAGTNLSASGITTDITGAIRPMGTAFDMGAYEFGTLSDVTTPLQDMIGFVVLKNSVISRFDGFVQVFSITGKTLNKVQVAAGQEIRLYPGAYIVYLSTTKGKLVQKVVL